MPSGPIKAVAIRREKIARMLSMSVTSPSEISKELGVAYDTVRDDIDFIKNESKDRMFGLARDGYAHDCFMAVDACMRYEASMEKELKELEDDPKSKLYERLLIRKQLVETKIARLNIEGEGPTLMAVRGVIKGDFLSDVERNQSDKMRKKT